MRAHALDCCPRPAAHGSDRRALAPNSNARSSAALWCLVVLVVPGVPRIAAADQGRARRLGVYFLSRKCSDVFVLRAALTFLANKTFRYERSSNPRGGDREGLDLR
jgi:hypothetical protein